MAGHAGLGTVLTMSTGALTSTSYNPAGPAIVIGDLTNISGPSMSADQIDVSSHGSTGIFREFVAGFKDAGEISLEGNLTASGGADDLLDAFKDRRTRNFHINFPVPTATSTARLRWQLAGTVSGVETAVPYDDKVSFSASIRLTGVPTLTT
jgi:predicted secreted protein